MRNSRWVSMVAGKNLKRAEEAAGSFSARILGPRCVPRPRPPREKSTPSHPLRALLSVLLVSLCRERSRLRILSPSARPRLLSHLSPQRGILRSERNKERRLFVLFRSGRRSDDRYASIRQLLLNNSISRYDLVRIASILRVRDGSLSIADPTIARNIAAELAPQFLVDISESVHLFSDCSRLNDVWCIAFTQSTRATYRDK